MADLSELTDDQLEELMQNPAAAAAASAEPDKPEPEVEAVVPEVEPPEPSVSEPEPPAPEPEIEEDLEKASLKAVIDEMEARQKVLDSKLGKFAGEADFWRRKAEEANRHEPTQPDYPEAVEPESRPVTPRSPDPVLQWAVSQAVTAGEANFRNDHPDYSGDIEKEVMSKVGASGYDTSRLFADGNPMSAQKEAYRILDEHYWHVKQERASVVRAGIEQRKTEQFARQKEAKQRASVSGSGGTPSPKAVAKTLDQLTDAELDAEMRRLTER